MSAFNSRIYYRLEIKLESPLSIGSGENNGTDHDVIVDKNGVPFIPATAIAGVLRHSFTEGTEDIAKQIFGNIPQSSEENSSEQIDGKIIVCDARKSDDEKKFYVAARDSVKLENKVGVKGKKFDMQSVEPGVVFISYIELLDSRYSDALEQALAKMNAGLLRFGAKTSRGYGQVSLKVKKETVNTFDEYSVFAVYDETEWGKREKYYKLPEFDNKSTKITLSLKVRGGISIRKYSTDVGRPDYETLSLHNDVPVIPGTSWAGAIRSRFEEIIGESGLKPEEKMVSNALFGFVNSTKKDEAVKSKIIISESQIKGGTYKESTRNSIDRFSGATKDKALYTERTYFNGETALELIITKELSDKEKFALAAVIADLHNGFLAVGGLTSIGRGLFEIIKVNGEASPVQYLDADSVNLSEFIGEVF